MSIASEIAKLIQNLADSYTAANLKGATIPQDENFDNLPSTIATIQTGGGSTLITKNIYQNGIYNASSDDADGYSQVTVAVPSSQRIDPVQVNIGVNIDIPINGADESITIIDPSIIPSYTWDLTAVGSLTVDDGVYSGFSNSKNLLMKTKPSSNTSLSSFEMSFRFTTGSSVSSEQTIIGNQTSNYSCPQIGVDGARFYLIWATSGSSWNVQYWSGTNTISANTEYKVDFTWSSGSGSGTLTRISDGTTYPITLTSGTPSVIYWSQLARIGNDQASYYSWTGSIDLKHSYMKFDGQYVDCTPD